MTRFRDICWNSVYTDLLTLNSICELADINYIVESIIELFDVHAPIRTCIIREVTYPWITDNNINKLMMWLRDNALRIQEDKR